MTLSTIRSTLAGASMTVSGTTVKGYAQVPDTLEPPCFLIYPSKGNPHESGGSVGTIKHSLEAVFYVVKGGTVTDPQTFLDGLLAPSGAGSAFVAFYAVDLASLTPSASLINMGYRNYGALEFAGEPYVGFVMDLEVLEG